MGPAANEQCGDVGYREAVSRHSRGQTTSKVVKVWCRRGKTGPAHIGKLAFFSWISISNCARELSRARDRDGTRIRSRQSLIHAHRDDRSSPAISDISPATGEVLECDTSAWR